MVITLPLEFCTCTDTVPSPLIPPAKLDGGVCEKAILVRLYSVGYADSADGTGVNPTPNTVEIRFTLGADANLDGQVSLSDFSILTTTFGVPLPAVTPAAQTTSQPAATTSTAPTPAISSAALFTPDTSSTSNPTHRRRSRKLTP